MNYDLINFADQDGDVRLAFELHDLNGTPVNHSCAYLV